MQIASAVLEGSHLDLVTQPLDLQILEEVVLIVLDDNLLQFPYLALHSGTKLSFHLQQSLRKCESFRQFSLKAMAIIV